MVKVLDSFVRGPLAPYVEGFATQLLREGYTSAGAQQHVCFIAHLDRWLTAAGLDVADLKASLFDRYFVERRAAGYVQYLSVKALRPLLDYLAPLGVLPQPETVELAPADALLADYRSYLLAERGLTAGTARGYVDAVRPFVVSQFRAGRLDLSGLDAADVTGFVLATCPGRAVGSAKLIVCALRSFLNWLHLTGTTSVSWASAAPAVAGWRLSGLPKGLEPGQLQKAAGQLRSTHRNRQAGLRDLATAVPAGAARRRGYPPWAGRHRLAPRRAHDHRQGQPRRATSPAPTTWVLPSRPTCGAADPIRLRDAPSLSGCVHRIGP